MSEMINSYPIQDPETLVPMDRKKFYEEQIAIFKETGKPTRAVDAIAILIFNSKGEILLQKRSYDKSHNPGLIDKSMGGHVQYGDAIDYTVMVETVQELHTPSVVLKSKADFDKTYKLLHEYLGTLAIVRHIDSEIRVQIKLIDDEPIDIANRLHMYFGVYDGRVRPADGEAQGVLWYSLEDLDKEMKRFPDTFTHDLGLFLKEYKDEIRKFIDYIKV